MILRIAPIAQPYAASADPVINERFYNPAQGEWLPRFEGEIYARRNDIAAASGAQTGMTVADEARVAALRRCGSPGRLAKRAAIHEIS